MTPPALVLDVSTTDSAPLDNNPTTIPATNTVSKSNADENLASTEVFTSTDIKPNSINNETYLTTSTPPSLLELDASTIDSAQPSMIFPSLHFNFPHHPFAAAFSRISLTSIHNPTNSNCDKLLIAPTSKSPKLLYVLTEDLTSTILNRHADNLFAKTNLVVNFQKTITSVLFPKGIIALYKPNSPSKVNPVPSETTTKLIYIFHYHHLQALPI